MLYAHLQHHNDTIIKTQWQRQTQGDFFTKIYTSHFIARVRKGCVGLYCERELEIEHNCNILTPHSYGHHVVSFSFFWCSTGALGSTLLGAGFLYCILSVSSLDLNSSGPKGPFGLMWLSLPHFVSDCLELYWQLHLDSNSTELYNGSTPTRSLKLHVWSSSSGNNCHAVYRSLPSGESVYECTMGFFLARPISSANFHPHDFLS